MIISLACISTNKTNRIYHSAPCIQAMSLFITDWGGCSDWGHLAPNHTLFEMHLPQFNAAAHNITTANSQMHSHLQRAAEPTWCCKRTSLFLP